MNRQTTLSLPTAKQLQFTPHATGSLVQERGVRLHAPAEHASPVASFVPMHYESNYSYPLIVWLHGAGQSERDLPRVMRYVSTRNYVAVAPRGLEDTRHGENRHWPHNSSAIETAEQRVFDAIEYADERLSVNTSRVFLAGIGCGGSMALRLALSNPRTFAGAASFDGPLPTGQSLLRNLDAMRSLPLLLAASKDSAAYPESQLCQDLRLLHSAGATLSIRQYPGQDDLTTAMLADFDRWLMEIVCGQTANV